MSMLDCFCGMGGVSNGYAKEGYDVTGIDNIDAPNLLGYNHKFIQSNILDLDGKDFQGYDVIWGSPPCREFTPCATVFGHRWKKTPNLENGLKLVHAFLKFVEDAKPKIWIMENHPNLIKHIELEPLFVGQLSKGMRRAFWSNKQLFFLMPTSNKPSIWKHSWDTKIRSWQRAKIPIGCSRAFARACKELCVSPKRE